MVGHQVGVEHGFDTVIHGGVECCFGHIVCPACLRTGTAEVYLKFIALNGQVGHNSNRVAAKAIIVKISGVTAGTIVQCRYPVSQPLLGVGEHVINRTLNLCQAIAIHQINKQTFAAVIGGNLYFQIKHPVFWFATITGHQAQNVLFKLACACDTNQRDA